MSPGRTCSDERKFQRYSRFQIEPRVDRDNPLRIDRNVVRSERCRHRTHFGFTRTAPAVTAGRQERAQPGDSGTEAELPTCEVRNEAVVGVASGSKSVD